MNLSLYAAASGMEAQQTNINTISNNIANVNTTGFKKSKAEFQDLLYQSLRPSGGDGGAGNVIPTSIEMGNGTQVVSTSKIFSQGDMSQTSNDLDIAIQGDGFLQVSRADGTTVYTRDGALKIDATGQVVTNDGLPVDGFTNVPEGTTDIFISSNGEVTYLDAEGNATNFRIQLHRFVNPGGLKALGNNLFQETAASGTAEAGNPEENGYGSLRQGFLELSNVNIVQEMVNLIVAQRAYEINSKAIQTSDDMLSQINQLKR